MIRRSRFLRRTVLLMTAPSTLIAVVLALVLLGAVVLRLADKPHNVRLAVGPSDGADAKFAEALGRELPKSFWSTRVVLERAETLADVADRIDDDKAQLAIVRTDVAMPKSAGTMLVVHRDVTLFLATPDSKITELSALDGKKIGIVPGDAPNIALLDTILTQNGIDTEGITRVPLKGDALADAVAKKTVDAVMVVAPVGSEQLESAVAAMAGPDKASPEKEGANGDTDAQNVNDARGVKPRDGAVKTGADKGGAKKEGAGKGGADKAGASGGAADKDDADESGAKGPAILPVKNAEALEQGLFGLTKVEIPSGLFPGSPPQPDDEIETVAVDSQLVARLDMSEGAVDQLTRTIFQLRRALAATAPVANFMMAPDTAKGTRYALHTGATSYYQDTEKSFMDRYGDWFYIMAMVFGGAGSAIASLIGSLQARARRQSMAIVDQLTALRKNAVECADETRLREVERSVSDLTLRSLDRAREGRIDQAGLEILRLAVEETRRTIADRAVELAASAKPPSAIRAV